MIKSLEDSMEHNYSSRQFSVFALVSVSIVLLGGLFVLSREYNDAMGRKKPLVKTEATTQSTTSPVAEVASSFKN